MASEVIRYVGLAPLVVQVDTFTPAAVDIGDTFTLTITGYDGRVAAITFTATVATAANVSAGLVAAWNASTNPLCTPITAADLTGTLTLTADVAGVAFEVAGTSTGGTLTRAATTPNSGPSDWRNLLNWSGYAGLPGGAATQTVYIENATILYGLDQSAIANTLSGLYIQGTTRIGTNPEIGYLPVYLKIKATIVDIGRDTGYGSPSSILGVPVLIDTGATQSLITVYNSGNNVSGFPAIWLKTGVNTTKIIVKRGSVGIGWSTINPNTETSTLNALEIWYVNSIASDAIVYIGDGVTFSGGSPNILQKGGIVLYRSAVTLAAFTAGGGSLQTEGVGILSLLTVQGSAVVANSTGAITAASLEIGSLDTMKSNAPRTIGTLHLHVGATFKWNKAYVTLTNAITFDDPVVLTPYLAA